jgi:hypothetical protein
MTEDRKYAILFAATLLCARKLIELDSDRPSPAKVAAVENAISQAAFILECIDRKWPKKRVTAGREKKAPGSGLGLCRRIEWGAALTAGRIPHPNSSSNRYSNFSKAKCRCPWAAPRLLQSSVLGHCKLSFEWHTISAEVTNEK